MKEPRSQIYPRVFRGDVAPDVEEWLESGEWEEVMSSNVQKIRYLKDQEQLEVIFLNNYHYSYEPVPPNVARAMYTSPSMGKFVWNEFRRTQKYRVTRLA